MIKKPRGKYVIYVEDDDIVYSTDSPFWRDFFRWKKEHLKEMEAGKGKDWIREEEDANPQDQKEGAGSEMSKLQKEDDNLYGYTIMSKVWLGNNIWIEVW